jgi:large subunit ribosomal protein L6
MMEIEVPANVQIEIKGNEITTKGSAGTNSRKFNDALLKLAKQGNKIVIDSVKHKQLAKKASMAEVSIAKHIKNDMLGVNAPYERNMQVVFAHFPITVEVKGDTIMIKNLIGERAPRTAALVGATKVEIKGANIRIYGPNIDDVSQTCANMRKACKIREKDSRVFQDGIYFAIE